MKNDTKKKILISLATCLAILGVLCGIFIPNHDIKNVIDETQSIVQNEIIEIEEQEKIENPSTQEIPELTEEDEQTIEVQETESEAFEEQGEIAYNGSDKAPSVSVGKYAGLTYFSQTDSRWGYKMYSNHGDSSQTIANSGCGPTSASMVVSSIRGTITPDVMSDLYVDNGYRSYNNGTYWSAFRWTADVFDIDYTETSSLDSAVDKLRDGYYLIASCGNGLFTYGGHFIAIVGINGKTLKIYDPYLYSWKFDTSTRRGKVSVDGHTVYCSIDNFRNYANYGQFFCYKNDRTDTYDNDNNTYVVPSNSNVSSVNYTVRVTANSGLNVRSGASTSYPRVGGYAKNTVVTIYSESNGWGKTSQGWINLSYTTRASSGSSYSSSSSYSTGRYKVTASLLNVRTGPSTGYRAKKYYELSSNARSQNRANGNYYANGYKYGVVCTVSRVSGNWGLTPSGWICLSYCRKY